MQPDRLALALALSCLGPAAPDLVAQVRCPNIFGHDMVLQRDRTVPIWGTTRPGAEVVVSFAGQRSAATSDPKGRWQVELRAMPASAEGRELSVEGGGGRIVFRNVLVGEVWVCSGQSNMEWTVNASRDAAEEKNAARYPAIRHIKVPRVPADHPQQDFDGAWTICSPDTVGNFTAVGYYFARRLHQELRVPIGLINTSWGGTRIEPWIPLAGFRQIREAAFAPEIIERIEAVDPTTATGKKTYGVALARYEKWLAGTKDRIARGSPPEPAPEMPSLGSSHQSAARLYRGMVAPLVGYGIRGAIWYQGESNGQEGMTYFEKMRALVGGWREVWGQGAFPFYFVQLANFTADKQTPEGGDGYARIRDAQRQSLRIENTGMAVIIDIGDTRDIHPRNKQDVGGRLAQWALAKDYGRDIVPSGPLYSGHTVEDGRIRVRFDHVGGGLMVGTKKGLQKTRPAPGAKLARFAIAGADKQWHWADAVIDGDAVVVSSAAVPNPVAVRYGFSANPLGANLYNVEGLPASPFRTDDW